MCLRCAQAQLRLSKNSKGVFRQQAADCCAHELSANSVQPAHLQAGVYFPDVHAAGKNDLHLFRACGRETLRGFFDTLKCACAARRHIFNIVEAPV